MGSGGVPAGPVLRCPPRHRSCSKCLANSSQMCLVPVWGSQGSLGVGLGGVRC